MKAKKFEKKIRHLSQKDIVAGNLHVLNRVLIDSGYITKSELQKMFLDWMKDNKLDK